MTIISLTTRSRVGSYSSVPDQHTWLLTLPFEKCYSALPMPITDVSIDLCQAGVIRRYQDRVASLRRFPDTLESLLFIEEQSWNWSVSRLT